MNGHEVLQIARERYPECEWEATPEGLQGTDRAKRVRVLRIYRDDSAEMVVEAARKHLRKCKPLGARA